MNQTGEGSAHKPAGQVYASFDDLFAARTSSGASYVPAISFSGPLSTRPPDSGGGLSSQPLATQALISPRYEFPTATAPPLQFISLPQGSPALYSGLISPRYDLINPATLAPLPQVAPTITPLIHPVQPLVFAVGPQPTPISGPIFPPQQPQAGQNEKQIWNPFWEDFKDGGDSGAVISPRGGEDGDLVDVHVVEELSDDSNDDEADEDGEKYDDRRYRNFQLRTSGQSLANSSSLQNAEPAKTKKKKKKKQPGPTIETKTVKTTTTTTFKAAPLSKSQEHERWVEEQREQEQVEHYHGGPRHQMKRLHDSSRGRSDSGASLIAGSGSTRIEFNWHPKLSVSNRVMRGLIQVNCLVKGDYTTPAKKWLIPIDNTPASVRAFDYVMKLAGPSDHIFIVHVREWVETDCNLRDAYLKWRKAVKLCRRFRKKLVAAERPHTILVPVYHDVRKIIVKLAKKFHIDTIAIGKHGPEDKKLRVKNIHFRSFSKYVSNHAKYCHTIIV